MRYALWTCALGPLWCCLPAVALLGPAWNLDRDTPQVVAQIQPPIQVAAPTTPPVPVPAWPTKLPMMFWAAGVLAMFMRIAAGHWRVHSLFGAAEKIRDPRWLALVEETASSILFNSSNRSGSAARAQRTSLSVMA